MLSDSDCVSLAAGLRSGRHIWVAGAATLRVHCGTAEVHGYLLSEGQHIQIVAPPYDAPIPVRALSPRDCRMYGGDAACKSVIEAMRASSAAADAPGRRSRSKPLDGADFLRVVVSINRLPGMEPCLSDYDMTSVAAAHGGPLAQAVPGACVLLRQPATQFGAASRAEQSGGCFLSLFEDVALRRDIALPRSMQPAFAAAFGRSVDSGGASSAAAASLCKVSASSFVLSPAWKRALRSVARRYSAWLSAASATASSAVDSAGFPHERPRCPVIMVFGAKGAGKSTFVRLLVNKLLSAAEQHARADGAAGAASTTSAAAAAADRADAEPTAASTVSYPRGVAYLDLDVGQPEHGPPGMLTLSLVTQPLLTPPHLRAPHFLPGRDASRPVTASLGAGSGADAGAAAVATAGAGAASMPVPHAVQPVATVLSARFFGDVTPASDPALFSSAVRELLGEYHIHAACCGPAAGPVAGADAGDAALVRPAAMAHTAAPLVPLVPLVINCHGWMKGLGYETLQAAAEAACPSEVVYLDSRDEAQLQRNRSRRQGASTAAAAAGGAGAGAPAMAAAAAAQPAYQERVPEPGDFYLAAYADPALAFAMAASSSGDAAGAAAGGKSAAAAAASRRAAAAGTVSFEAGGFRLRRHQHLHHMPAVVIAPAAAVAASRGGDDTDAEVGHGTDGARAGAGAGAGADAPVGVSAGALSALFTASDEPALEAGLGIDSLHPPTHPQLGPPALAALPPRKAALAARLLGGVSAAAVAVARQRERFVIPDYPIAASGSSASGSLAPSTAAESPVRLHMLRAWHMSALEADGEDDSGSDDDDSAHSGSDSDNDGDDDVDADAEHGVSEDSEPGDGDDGAASVASSSSSTASQAISLDSSGREDAEAVDGAPEAADGDEGAVAAGEADGDAAEEAVGDDDGGPPEDEDDDDAAGVGAGGKEKGSTVHRGARVAADAASDADDADNKADLADAVAAAAAAADGARNRPPPRAARSPADARAARLMSYFTWGAVATLAAVDDEALCDAFEACCSVQQLEPLEHTDAAAATHGSVAGGAGGSGAGATLSTSAFVHHASADALAGASARSFIVGELAAELKARRAALLALARETLACVLADARMARAPSAGATSPAALFAGCPAMTVRVGPGSGMALLASPSEKLPLASALGTADDQDEAPAAAGESSPAAAARGFISEALIARARGFEGQLVGLCSSGQWLQRAAAGSRGPSAPCGGKLPCIGLGYVRRFDAAAGTLHIVTPVQSAQLQGDAVDVVLPHQWAVSAGSAAVADRTPLQIDAHTGVDVLVCWRGAHDMPLALLHRASPHGDSFTVAATDLTSVRETAAAGASRPGRKNLKRRRIGE